MSDANSSNKTDAYLGLGSKVNGSLVFTGTVEIDGEVEGEITAKEKLVVGESAKLKAKICGSEVLVKGTVNGDIQAKKLSLKKPAKVTGNIHCEILSIEEGVIFDGKATMAGSLSDKIEKKDNSYSNQSTKHAGAPAQ